jgi:hypothetical protein
VTTVELVSVSVILIAGLAAIVLVAWEATRRDREGG